MSTILELREKRAKVWEKAKAFLDSKRDSENLISAEDSALYDKMEQEVINLGKEIDRLEKQSAIDSELSKSVNLPIFENPKVKLTRSDDDYKSAFWNAIRGKINYEVKNSLNEGTDADGGYLVPDEFEKTLVQALEEENIFRRLAKIIKTSSGDRQIPIVTTKGTAAWVAEEALIPDSDDTFGQVLLSAHKVATGIKVSNELLNDSAFNLESYIATEFAGRIGDKEEEAFFSGDGSGKPTGILAATGGAPIGVTAASQTAITLDDMIDLFFSLRSVYRKNAVFLANDSSIKAIRKLKDSTGQYLWQSSTVVGNPDTILGRPVYTSQYMPAITASAKTFIFGDFSYYWIAERQNRTFQRLNELYAETGQIGFIASERVDGKLILPEAISILQQAGSST
jgi:HK97 family phage major capsid protein